MKKSLKFLLALISLSIIASCTKELDVSLENLNQSRKVSITISQFSQSWATLEVYASFPDYVARSNPIYMGSYRQTITLDNLVEGFYYLRMRGDGFRAKSYFYNEAIIVPAYNCDINFYTREYLWILEK
jgi:hypothetical protein